MGEFIVAESFGTAGEQGERQVVEALKAGLRKWACLGYWRHPLNSFLNNLKEPDILLLDSVLASSSVAGRMAPGAV